MKYAVLALTLALTLAASVALSGELPSYPVDVQDGGPAVQGTITTSSEPAMPSTLTSEEITSVVTRHVDVADWRTFTNDNATVFDPIVSARIGHRAAGFAFFGTIAGREAALPYVYCADHRIWEALPIVEGATWETPAAVAAAISESYRARVGPTMPQPAESVPVVQTVPAVYQAPPARAIVTQPSIQPSAPEELKAEHSFPWTAFWWCVGLLGFVILWMIASYVTEEMFAHRRPIRIEASEHNREVDAFQGRLTRDADHLRRLNAAVDEEERRFIDRITRIQKGA